MCRLYILLLLTAFSVLPSFARARSYGWCQKGNTTVTLSGFGGYQSTPQTQGSFPGCTVTVYLAGTTTLAPTIYSDDNGTVKANPFTADTTGYWYFYSSDGAYDVATTGLGTTAPTSLTLGDVRPNDAYTQPLTGGVKRLKGDKMYDTVSVRDFGAKCDGATDDSTAIQAAVTFALSHSDVNGIVGGSVYIPAGECMVKKTITITKAMPGGFTMLGDGPEATRIITPVSGFVGTSVFNINSNGGALVMAAMSIQAAVGGTPGVDAIYTTGNGQFYSRMWLAGYNAGLRLYQATSVAVSNVLVEQNVFGFYLDTTYSNTITNCQTYHNTAAGIWVTGQVPTSFIGGPGGVTPANEFSNVDMLEDLTGGGGNSAVYYASNAPLLLNNIDIASTNNGRPTTAVYMDTGAYRIDAANVHISHAMNFGYYALAGYLNIVGGVIDQLGQYSTITVPPGGYSSTTQVAGIYAGASVSQLSVTGLTIHNSAGYGINSAATYTSLINNLINGFALGNSSGGQQNSTTGLIGILLAPAQTYAQPTLIGNTVNTSATGATAVSYNPTATVATGAFQARNNTLLATTLFSTTATAVQLRAQNVDLDGITRFAGGRIITTGAGSELDVVGPSGNPSIHIADALEGSWNDFGFVLQPGSYGEIHAVTQGVGSIPLELQPSGGNVLFGTRTDNGSGANIQTPGSVSAGAYKIGITAGYTGTVTCAAGLHVNSITVSGGLITAAPACN